MIKSGVEVSQFTPKSVVYSDGSEQEADVVIFAFVHTFSIIFALLSFICSGHPQYRLQERIGELEASFRRRSHWKDRTLGI